MDIESGLTPLTIHSADQALATRPTDFERRVYCVLGLPVDAVDRGDALSAIRDAVRSRRPLYLSTPNLNFLIGSRTDVAFRDTVLHSDLVIADGMPLLWIARLLRIPIRERVAGSDVFEALQHDEAGPLSAYFFGGPPGVAQQACEAVNRRGGAMRCVGWASPGFGGIEDISRPEDLEPIVAARPDFIVVALGGKKGQAWIEHNRRVLRAPVIAHLGAVINFVAGTVVRAPLIFQKTGLEWLWRIKEEPALWKRYLHDGVGFLRLVFGHVIPLMLQATRDKGVPARAPATLRIDVATATLYLDGAWRDASLAPLRDALRILAEQETSVTLDLRTLLAVDSAVLGLLLLLHGHQSGRGFAMTVHGPTRRVVRAFVRHGADFLLAGLSAAPRTSAPPSHPS